jgi:hypothetical protein
MMMTGCSTISGLVKFRSTATWAHAAYTSSSAHALTASLSGTCGVVGPLVKSKESEDLRMLPLLPVYTKRHTDTHTDTSTPTHTSSHTQTYTRTPTCTHLVLEHPVGQVCEDVGLQVMDGGQQVAHPVVCQANTHT